MGYQPIGNNCTKKRTLCSYKLPDGRCEKREGNCKHMEKIPVGNPPGRGSCVKQG